MHDLGYHGAAGTLASLPLLPIPMTYSNDNIVGAEKKYDTPRYAFALMPTITDDFLHYHRHGIALNFPIHITLRGRFIPSPNCNEEMLLDVLRRAASCVVPIECHLTGPVSPSSNMFWYEVAENTDGRTRLAALHTQLNTQLYEHGYIQKDETPEAHQINLYRPHLTMSWVADTEEPPPIPAKNFRMLLTTPVVFKYEAPPEARKVICIT